MHRDRLFLIHDLLHALDLLDLQKIRVSDWPNIDHLARALAPAAERSTESNGRGIGGLDIWGIWGDSHSA